MMQARTLPDDQLVQLYLGGKESALGELLDRHKDRIYTYIFLFVRDTYCLLYTSDAADE